MTSDSEADQLSALESERRAARKARCERTEVRKRRRIAEMLSVRLPVDVHASLIAAARREGISRNSLIVESIRKRLGLIDSE